MDREPAWQTVYSHIARNEAGERGFGCGCRGVAEQSDESVGKRRDRQTTRHAARCPETSHRIAGGSDISGLPVDGGSTRVGLSAGYGERFVLPILNGIGQCFHES